MLRSCASLRIFENMNINTRSMKKIVLVLFSALSLGAAAQKTSGKITLTKGQKLEVVTNLNITGQSMMGPSSGTVTFADTYTVQDAAPNSYTLVRTPKNIKMNFSVGSQEIKLDSDNPQDLEGALGQPIKEIMEQRPEFTIDANGKIVAVKEGPKKKEEGAGGSMMSMMLPGLDAAAGIPKVGNPSVFQILPAKEIGIGDSWNDSVNADGNMYQSVYKVKGITDKEVVVDFETEGTTKMSQETMGMKVNVDAASKVAGTVLIDKATGLIKQKTTTNNTETTMNLGGNEMTTTNKITSVMNVITL
jgi:hypothetical protein